MTNHFPPRGALLMPPGTMELEPRPPLPVNTTEHLVRRVVSAPRRGTRCRICGEADVRRRVGRRP